MYHNIFLPIVSQYLLVWRYVRAIVGLAAQTSNLYPTRADIEAPTFSMLSRGDVGAWAAATISPTNITVFKTNIGNRVLVEIINDVLPSNFLQTARFRIPRGSIELLRKRIYRSFKGGVSFYVLDAHTDTVSDMYRSDCMHAATLPVEVVALHAATYTAAFLPLNVKTYDYSGLPEYSTALMNTPLNPNQCEASSRTLLDALDTTPETQSMTVCRFTTRTEVTDFVERVTLRGRPGARPHSGLTVYMVEGGCYRAVLTCGVAEASQAAEYVLRTPQFSENFMLVTY
jgi:hypothetical protein